MAPPLHCLDAFRTVRMHMRLGAKIDPEFITSLTACMSKDGVGPVRWLVRKSGCAPVAADPVTREEFFEAWSKVGGSGPPDFPAGCEDISMVSRQSQSIVLVWCGNAMNKFTPNSGFFQKGGPLDIFIGLLGFYQKVIMLYCPDCG